MKKFTSLLLAVIMTASLGSTALATDRASQPVQVTVNEYDMYVAERNAATHAKTSNDSPILSDEIENRLTELSLLSSQELQSLGYNEEQISILHNYQGERIETNPALRGVFADMTAKFKPYTANSSTITIKLEWSWTNAPLLAGYGIEDMAAMRWQGTDSAGSPLNVAYNSSKSSCLVKYYDRSGNYQHNKLTPITCDSPYDHLYSVIPMCYNADETSIYAKEGILTVSVSKTGTSPINEVAFVFAYGHSTFLEPSISIPSGFSINFTGDTEKMVEVACRYSSSGNLIEY